MLFVPLALALHCSPAGAGTQSSSLGYSEFNRLALTKARAHLQTSSAKCLQTSLVLLSFMFANNLQTTVRCFLFLVGNVKQDAMFASVDVCLNVPSSEFREQPQSKCSECEECENMLKLGNLKPVTCSTFQNQ